MGFVTCTPDEVMVVSGLFHKKKPFIQVGGAKIVLPWVQKIEKMSLKLITLDIETRFYFTVIVWVLF